MIPIRISEESVWELTQQNRQLQEFRADIHQIWDDSAARQVNGRHLDPLAQDGEQLLAAMQAQHNLLDAAHEKLGEAHLQGLDASRAGASAREALRLAEVEIRNGQRLRSRSGILLTVLRRGIIPKIQQALKCAHERGA